MLNTIKYAMHIFYNRKREWNKIIDRGMGKDFSWKTSAKEYEKLYNDLTSNN
jgi:starch synthase